MSQIVATPEMAKQLAEASGPVMIVNDQGKMIGYFRSLASTPTHYTPEEIERRRRELEPIREEIRKNPGQGKSMVEVMAYLHALGQDSQ